MGHYFEHFYLVIDVLDDNPSTRLFLIERLFRFRQGPLLAILD